jgi:hypothetical protein
MGSAEYMEPAKVVATILRARAARAESERVRQAAKELLEAPSWRRVSKNAPGAGPTGIWLCSASLGARCCEERGESAPQSPTFFLQKDR